MNPQKNYRIGLGMGVLLSLVALLFDAVNWIPLIGTVIAGIYWVGLSIYLKMTGHGLISARRLAPTLISFAVEIWPALQALPSIFAATVAIVILSRLEDKTGLHMLPHKGGGTKLPQKSQPLNQNGIRMPVKREDSDELDMAA